MTSVKFLADKSSLYGFEISGHSSKNCDDEVGKTVCAAVSSAAYMAANTIIEIMQIDADAEVSDGMMKATIPKQSADNAKDILLGLELHIKELAEQYPQNVTITTTEV